MSKRKHIDYKVWLEENTESLNITVLGVVENNVTFQCNVCGVIRTVQIKSLYVRGKEIHSEACSKILNQSIENEVGKENLNIYRSMYRRSKERCSNPKNKDYDYYKGKFKFNDFSHFYNETYALFLQALKQYPNETLSMDRIDNNLGYEPNNVRFVPMRINLQNKDCVRPIMCVNIHTNSIFTYPSANSVAKDLLGNVNCTSSVLKTIQNNSIYKKTWKFFYLE